MLLNELQGLASREITAVVKVLTAVGVQGDARWSAEEVVVRGRRFWEIAKGVGPKTMAKLDQAITAAGLAWANGSQLAMVPATEAKVIQLDKPVVRASALNLGLICPGSIFLSARLKDRKVDTSTVYTGVGTLGHEALQVAFERGFQAMREYLEAKEAGLGFMQELSEFWEYLAGEGRVAVVGDLPTRCEAPMEYQAGEVLVTGTRDLVQVQGEAAVVADWKFYNDPSMLPDIAEDIQMICYGVGTAAELGLSKVEVRRYLIYYRRADVLSLEGEMLEMAQAIVREEAETAWAGRTTFNVGAQCRSCLVRQHCTAYRNHGRDISTAEIAPYVGGAFTAPEQALRFLLAIPLIEERLEAGKEAAKAWALEHGAIDDPASGKAWGPQQREQDEIVDPAGCLAELMKVTDQKTALAAAKTTKGGLEGGLKEKGAPPAERKAFLERLRELGLMAKKKVERWEWK